MRSSEVARIAGVTVRTLRHYHALGLLPEPPRSANGYRDYAPADLARVLRIKRLASLGFPLTCVGEVMAQMDADEPEGDTAADPLAELDRELEQEIARLEGQRRVIASLRAERLRPDLPVPFGQALRLLASDEDLAGLTEEEQATLVIAGHAYGAGEVAELRRVAEALEDSLAVSAIAAFKDRLKSLAADAPEEERAELAAEALEALAPLIPCFSRDNWLRPPTEGELLLEEASRVGMNAAQCDVTARIERGIENLMAERAE